MLYALLIYQADGALDHLSDQERETMLAGHRKLQEDTKAAGAFLSAVQLGEGYAASTVRRSGTRVSVEDGPFAETKELLIGLYLLQCADLDAAVAYAEQIPHAEWGAIEVRPVEYFGDHSGMENP